MDESYSLPIILQQPLPGKGVTVESDGEGFGTWGMVFVVRVDVHGKQIAPLDCVWGEGRDEIKFLLLRQQSGGAEKGLLIV